MVTMLGAQGLSRVERRLLQAYRLVGVAFIHAASLLALSPYFFSWVGVASCLFGYFFIALPGINIGYHRLLAHNSVTCSKRMERFLAALGVLNLQFGPAYWVAIHRRHHAFTDASGDPHSPRGSFLRSHLFFLFPIEDHTDPVLVTEQYAKDLMADPFYAWFERRGRELWFWATLPIWCLYFLVPYVIASVSGEGASEATRLGLSVVVWGVFVRTVMVWHITFSVNSVTHLWGSRSYATHDDSRNNPIVGMLAFGEGWHNNHHAFPRSARHGHAWWQFDATWMAIQGLAALGLVTIKDPGPTPEMRAARRSPVASKA